MTDTVTHSPNQQSTQSTTATNIADTSPPSKASAKIRRALISVSNKDQLIELAQTLRELDIDILSTGGSAKHLKQAGIEVRDVADLTQFPEIMDGRVKTLHPKIHGGILARRDQDQAACQEHAIECIDLVVVNLYPFTQVIAAEHNLEQAIENIDIGGPSMLRAAAKNYAWVTVVCDSDDYPWLQQTLRENGAALTIEQRFRLAQKAFTHTAEYDAAISHYLAMQAKSPTQLAEGEMNGQVDSSVTDIYFPDHTSLPLHKQQDCRYGENPHQQAAVYAFSDCQPGDGQLAKAQCHQGKALSYNNFIDADAAWQCVNQFQEAPACVIVKHANPCGVAVDSNCLKAYQKAYACDATSAFGGIIAFNRELDGQTAEAILNQQFVEVILAPKITNTAQQVLASKPNVRALSLGAFNPEQQARSLQYTSISGGLMVQSRDWHPITFADCRVVSVAQPNEQQIQDLLFAWRVCQFVKSNAIVYAQGNRTVGIGAGQMSRVFSARIAGDKAAEAQLDLNQAVMASDAFFPFRDGIDQAAAVGIQAVIQPGGSKRDEEVIAAANEAGMVMVFTGVRHFRH